MKMDLGLTLAFVISAGYSWLDLPLSATFCHFLRLPRLPGFACDHNGSSFFVGAALDYDLERQYGSLSIWERKSINEPLHCFYSH
jgi:hypothetical protein